MHKCKICDAEYESYRGLTFHIMRMHRLKSETYYREHISEDGKLPTCKYEECDKEVLWVSGWPSSYCSKKCANTDHWIDWRESGDLR